MANIIYGEALADLGYPPDAFESATLFNAVHTATSLRVVDALGAGISFVGTGLTYSKGIVTGGTVTSITFFDATQAILYTVTAASLSASLVVDAIKQGDIYPVLSGNDLITGSAGRDVLTGDVGNDTINGGAGSDYLVDTGGGRDRFTGAQGKISSFAIPTLVWTG